jgi:hypothetical protein
MLPYIHMYAHIIKIKISINVYIYKYMQFHNLPPDPWGLVCNVTYASSADFRTPRLVSFGSIHIYVYIYIYTCLYVYVYIHD